MTPEGMVRAARILAGARARGRQQRGGDVARRAASPPFATPWRACGPTSIRRRSPPKPAFARTRGACGAGTRGAASAWATRGPTPATWRWRGWRRWCRELVVVTQNIDGLHAEAGSTDVVELHGNIRRVKCLDRGHPYAGPLPPYAEGEEQDPPPCPVCGSPLRPDVVWFGEMLPADAVERAWAVAERCEVLLLIGTSGTVWPAAELPLVARRRGALIVEMNPEPSELTHAADVFLAGPAGEVLPALLEAMRAMQH